MAPEDTAQLPVEGARGIKKLATPVKMAPFMAGEYGSMTQCIQGAVIGQRDSISHV